MNINNVTTTLRLREYYYMALRHKVVFLVLTVICLLSSVAIAFSLPKIYRAETILAVQDERVLNPLISGLAINPSVGSRMRTVREELLSWHRLTLLVEKLGLAKKINTPLEYERMMKSIRDKLFIRMRESDIVVIGFEGPKPKKAQEIVQTLSDIIIEGNLTSTKVEASSAIRFLQEQLDKYRVSLEQSEEQLRKFREIYSKSLPVATRLNEQLIALKIELNNLLVENTEEHPRVIQTKKLVQRLEQQRDEQMQQAKLEGVEIDPAEYAKLVTSVPRQEQHLAKLTRDYMVNANIYESLLQRLETAKISENLEQSDKGLKFRILEPARLPLEPVKPKKILIVLAGLLIGIALSCLAVYLLELSDTSIRNLDEARILLELPIFGSIPPIRPDELLVEQNLRGATAGVSL
ncbi:MAG: hypothetical protein HY447_00630 [Candidatus Omnitrophica bacterium]|nr:hypothetical protein [Candidatus Omnitrophota bacterium]